MIMRSFLKDEMEFLRDYYPPFTTLARVLIANRDEEKQLKYEEIGPRRFKEFERNRRIN